MNHAIRFEIKWFEEDEAWVCFAHGMRDGSTPNGFGDSPVEALQECKIALELIEQTAAE